MKDRKSYNIRLSLFALVISIIDWVCPERDSNYDYSNDIAPIEKGKLTRGGPHILVEYLTRNSATSFKKIKEKPFAVGYFYQDGWHKSRLFYVVYCSYCREFIVTYRVGFNGRFDCYNCESKILLK